MKTGLASASLRGEGCSLHGDTDEVDPLESLFGKEPLDEGADARQLTPSLWTKARYRGLGRYSANKVYIRQA